MENKIEEPMHRIVSNNFDDHYLNDFTTVDELTKEWIEHLKSVWTLWKACDGLSMTLVEYFSAAPNPYLSVLRITANISTCKIKTRKSSLEFTVIEEFAKWLKSQKGLQDFLVEDLKIVAFQLAIKGNNLEFFQLFADTYEFIKHKEVFIPFIENMIATKMFKEAAQYATVLKLQKHFQDVEVLLLPLILQNKIIIIEEFLAGELEIQKSLVQYLDNLIVSDTSRSRQLDKFILTYKIPDIQISILNRKPLSKLVARFVKLYSLPPTICLNLNRQRNEGALHFLLHKRYKDYSLSQASWREMVQEVVQEDTQLQLSLLKRLINVRDAKEGLYWAKKFDIPKEKWPEPISYEAKLMEANETNKGASSREKDSDWTSFDSSNNFHELRLPRNCITVVDTPQKFENFLDCGLKDVSIVGIDSEWKPNFDGRKCELAMLQIATEERVYILDLITMANTSKGLWRKLAVSLFQNSNILKLGFNIAHDLKMIRDSLPSFSNVQTKGYIDVIDLWNKLVEHQFVFPYAHGVDDQFVKKNLSVLVELCFGKKLNKLDQFSNWEQRPLREGQIIYAALDAYCLLEIYNAFKTQCARLNIQFLNICLEVIHGGCTKLHADEKLCYEK